MCGSYSVAVYGVPIRYFGDKPDTAEQQTDEEWCERYAIAPEVPEVPEVPEEDR